MTSAEIVAAIAAAGDAALQGPIYARLVSLVRRGKTDKAVAYIDAMTGPDRAELETWVTGLS